MLMDTTPEIVNNQGASRFEIHLEGKMAYQEYIQTKQDLVVSHTEVPKALEGKGLGSLLAKNALLYTEKSGLKMMPLCPFVATYIRKHYEDYKHLLSPGFNV